jgi:hypothetical protein
MLLLCCAVLCCCALLCSSHLPPLPPTSSHLPGKEALKSGLNIPGVAESYDEGGNLGQARWAKGLREGEQLPPSSW